MNAKRVSLSSSLYEKYPFCLLTWFRADLLSADLVEAIACGGHLSQ
jgi:hypothetical protein